MLGPLKRLRLRFANSTEGLLEEKGLGEPGAGLALDADGMPSLKFRVRPGPRTRRMLEGNAVAVGVLGRTLTEWCGDLEPPRGVLAVLMDPVELVELAFECE